MTTNHCCEEGAPPNKVDRRRVTESESGVFYSFRAEMIKTEVTTARARIKNVSVEEFQHQSFAYTTTSTLCGKGR